MSKLIDAFKAAPSAQRRIFLAEMAVNNTDPDSRALHAVLTDLPRN
jgi:hypothetical protein